MKFRSLGFRVTAWYAGMLAFSFLLFGTSTYFGLSTFLHWELRSSLLADSTSIAEKLLDHYRGQAFLSGEISEGFAPEVNAKFIRVTDSNNQVLYVSKPPLNGAFNPNSVPRLTFSSIPASDYYVDRKAGRAELYIVVLPYSAQDGHKYIVEVGAAQNRIHETLDALLLIFLIGMPAFVVLASFGGRYVMRAALRPIREITGTAEQISLSRPEVHLPVLQTGDEIEQLARALNRMLDRLDTAFQEIRRFSGDVSHELRTPLTILRGELEALLPYASVNMQDELGSCLEEVERMARIVDQLLVLARIDASGEIPRDIVDLGQLTKDTADQMHLLMEEKALAATFDIAPSVLVEANVWRIKQVIVNLLDNAIKYSRNGGTIDIKVSASAQKAWLEIRDQGEGIPAEALPRIFDRFYRADNSRSRGTGGTGLGLSIVKAIVIAHGGEVRIESIEGIGTTVCVELVLAQSHTAEPTISPVSPAAIVPS